MNLVIRRELFRGTAVWLLSATLVATTEAAGAPATGPAEPKTHTLFMGSDVAIERDAKLFQLKNVAGSSFVIQVNGEMVKVPMRGDPHNLKIGQGLRLSAISASVTGLKSERTYTPGNDPGLRRQRETVIANDALTDYSSLVTGQFSAAQAHFGSGINADKAPVSYANLEQIVAEASTKAMATEQMIDTHLLSSDLTNASLARVRADADRAQEQFDAVAVNFEVSSATPLNSPYVVVITRFHGKNAKPGEVRNAILAAGLDPIGEKPRRVELLQGGFPRGFEIEDVQVHLYNRGQEVATDVAPKRVPLTREEAFTYIKIEYLSSNKGATIPAAPALGKPEAAEMARLTSEQLRDVYFVKVSKEGLPLGTFADLACTRPVDPTVASLAGNVRFYPALENGKAVEGVARLLFTQLAL